MTDNGLRIDGLRVLYKLMLFPPDAALGCAVDVPTLDGPVTLRGSSRLIQWTFAAAAGAWAAAG